MNEILLTLNKSESQAHCCVILSESQVLTPSVFLNAIPSLASRHLPVSSCRSCFLLIQCHPWFGNVALQVSPQRYHLYSHKDWMPLYRFGIVCLKMCEECIDTFERHFKEILYFPQPVYVDNFQQTCRQQAVASHGNVSWYRGYGWFNDVFSMRTNIVII